MKNLLILFMFSTTAFASFKVDITNEENQQMSKSGFATEEDAQNYVKRVEKKWGKKQRWQKKTCKNPLNLIETREVEPENEEPFTEYHCKQTYSYSIFEDLDAAAKEAEKQARKDEISEIRAMKDQINNSTLPAWHKKLLKRLIKELRE